VRREDLAGSGEVLMAGPCEKSNAPGEILPSAEQLQASLGGVCSIDLFH
jgi:hypothetical protein